MEPRVEFLPSTESSPDEKLRLREDSIEEAEIQRKLARTLSPNLSDGGLLGSLSDIWHVDTHRFRVKA